MRNLRNLAAFALLLLSSTAFAASNIQTHTAPSVDGGDPPPVCAPNDPTCKP
jgi:hypothetical protein